MTNNDANESKHLSITSYVSSIVLSILTKLNEFNPHNNAMQ